jgi:hypothetical protein
MSNMKAMVDSFCKGVCSSAVRTFFEAIFMRGFKQGLAEGRRLERSVKSGENDIDGFVNQLCIRKPYEKVNATVLFHQFSEWYVTRHDGSKKGLPSATRFGRIMATRFSKKKSNGLVFYVGLVLCPQSHGSPGRRPLDDHTLPDAAPAAGAVTPAGVPWTDLDASPHR